MLFCFSSRRRHTRFDCDWSSDVCSSDLKAHAVLEKRREAGELGFLELPANAALHAQSVDFVKRTRGKFDDVVVLGIGGSALRPGPRPTPLPKPQWNTPRAGPRDIRPPPPRARKPHPPTPTRPL